MWRIDGAANWYRATTAYTTRPSEREILREKQMGHCHPSPKALGGVLSYFFFPISKKLQGLLAGTRVVWFLLYSAHSIHGGWGGPTATDNRDRTRIVYYFLCLSPSFHPFSLVPNRPPQFLIKFCSRMFRICAAPFAGNLCFKLHLSYSPVAKYRLHC